MTFTTRTLVNQLPILYVNQKQRYDAYAAALGGNSNWSLVDTVDQIVTTITWRTYVWKCASPGNGLAADFYLLFRTNFTTATVAYVTTDCYVSLCEKYDSATKTASKLATNPTPDATLDPDLTNPLTWQISTSQIPATVAYWSTSYTSNIAQQILGISVSAATFIVFGGTAAASGQFLYAGVFDSVLGATEDPMPIAIMGSVMAAGTGAAGSLPNQNNGASTRHPRATSGAPMPSVFNLYHGTFHWSANSLPEWGSQAAYTVNASTTSAGTLGSPTNSAYSGYLGGAAASKSAIATCGSAGTGVSRGGMRGYLRNILTGVALAHQWGDIFQIDGKGYVGLGRANGASTALLDTTA